MKSLLSFLNLVTCVFSPFFLVNLVKALSTLFIFSIIRQRGQCWGGGRVQRPERTCSSLSNEWLHPGGSCGPTYKPSLGPSISEKEGFYKESNWPGAIFKREF